MKLRAIVIMGTVTLAAGLIGAGPGGVSSANAAPEAHLSPGQAKQKSKGKRTPKLKRGQLAKDLALAPKGLRWGMSLKAVSKLYDDVLDKKFLALYKKTQPGSPKERALDIELRDKKQLISRNVVEFGKTPTGVDYTPLKGEYSYQNGEKMSWVSLDPGKKRHFFFFNDKLWKVYDEYKLRDSGPMGTTFDSALKKLATVFHSQPNMRKQDFEKGRTFDEAVWANDDLYVRALDRSGEGLVAIVYVERGVQDNLGRYRKNKPVDAHKMDDSVERVLRKSPEDGKANEKQKK